MGAVADLLDVAVEVGGAKVLGVAVEVDVAGRRALCWKYLRRWALAVRVQLLMVVMEVPEVVVGWKVELEVLLDEEVG